MMGAGANRTITWTDRSVYIPDGNNGYVDYINGVARSGNTFIAVGQKATIMRSTNGATWTRISPPAGTSASLEYLSVTYDSTNNRFVAISATTIMYSNNDGVTWSNAVTGQTNQVSIHYANNVYVIVGDSALIKTSSDGIAWTSRSYQREIDGIIKFIENGTGSDGTEFLEKMKNTDSYRKQNFLDTHNEIAIAMGY